MSSILKTVRQTIENFSMLERGDHVLIAVSGGADSVALLRVLDMLSNEYQLGLTIAHLNHGLRGGEADEDESFVRHLSNEMGIDFIAKRVDIRALQMGKGRSLEEIAREERYKFLEETAQSYGAGKIATGHHSDDHAETIILNLIRGSGLEGLKGIPPVRNQRIIRPLLRVTTREIHTFLQQEALPHVKDSSNVDLIFLRNKIRHQLLPELAAHYNPRIAKTLCKTAEIIRRDDHYLQSVVQAILLKWGIVPGRSENLLPLNEFNDLHEALRARIIKCLLESFTPCKTGIGYQHVDAVLKLCLSAGKRARSLDLPYKIGIEKSANILRINKMSARSARPFDRNWNRKLPEFLYDIAVPSVVDINPIARAICFDFVPPPDLKLIKKSPHIGYFDYDKISPPLILRSSKPGDRIAPLGMLGTKKLQDYYVDKKIPLSLRCEIPLLVDAGSVIWIAGQTISERVKIGRQTKKVLKAEII